MKKLTISIIMAVCALSLSGQISITRSDMPLAGDTFRFSTVQAIGANINVNNTGANHNWDFSKLGKDGEELLEYKSSAKTPYAFFFFNTYGNLVADNIGFGQFALTDVYNFYKATNTAFTAEGIGFRFNSIPLGGFYTDKDIIYEFPLNYNEVNNSVFKVKVQIPGFGSYQQSGTRKNTVDGWGEVRTPHRTYNCLRVKSEITQVDSFSVQQPFPVSFGFPSTRIEYKWLTKSDRVPVVEVTGADIAGNFVASSIRYRQDPVTLPPGVSVKEVAPNTEVKVYPNPATDKIVITLPAAGEDFVKLFTIDGKEVATTHTRVEQGIEINTQSFEEGFYMVFAKSGSNIVWEKVQISR